MYINYCIPVQRVLTAEFIDGCKISDVPNIKSMGLTLKDVSVPSVIDKYTSLYKFR